jgi:pilus assembly protein CpaE
MENALIRILPVCLMDDLPDGWDASAPGYVVEVAPEVAAPEDVLSALSIAEPDVLLFDADVTHFDVFKMTQQALAARPEMAVVIVSRDSAPERLRRAMLSGAEEYLIKPLDAKEMAAAMVSVTSHRTLRHVQRVATEETKVEITRGVIVGVVAGKGGLGKTTIACNLATLAARAKGREAALVGLESGDGAVLLALQPKLGLLDLAGTNAVDGQNANYSGEWVKQFATRHKNGLYYWTWQGSETQTGASIPEDFFEQIFESFRQTYSVTVIDFPILSPEEIAHVLPLLDVILVVTSSSDLLALRSARTLLDMIPAEMNDRIHLIINRADETDMIAREDFERALGRTVSGVISNQSRLAAEAINMGSPIVLMQPQSNIALNLNEVAQQLLNLPSRESNEPRRKRFLLFG